MSKAKGQHPPPPLPDILSFQQVVGKIHEVNLQKLLPKKQSNLYSLEQKTRRLNGDKIK